MAGSHRKEGVDDRFARHLREHRSDTLAAFDDPLVACRVSGFEAVSIITGETPSEATQFALHGAHDPPQLYDTNGFLGAEEDRSLTIPFHGLYLVIADVRWATSGDGERKTAIHANNGTTAQRQLAMVSGASVAPAAGDELVLQQAVCVAIFNEAEVVSVGCAHGNSGNINAWLESLTVTMLDDASFPPVGIA